MTPDVLWCSLQGRDVPIAECVNGCPAPEHKVVCAMEFRMHQTPTLPGFDHVAGTEMEICGQCRVEAGMAEDQD